VSADLTGADLTGCRIYGVSAWNLKLAGANQQNFIGYDALMELHDINPDRLLRDKGYDSDDIRYDLAERGIEPVIPPRSNRETPIEYDREAYKRRNFAERCVAPRVRRSYVCSRSRHESPGRNSWAIRRGCRLWNCDSIETSS
jgi:IS5 family transposase